MSDALEQLENVGFWMAGAATAAKEWESESSSVRAMLHALLDDYLDNGGDLSDRLSGQALPDVMDEIRAAARRHKDRYHYCT